MEPAVGLAFGRLRMDYNPHSIKEATAKLVASHKKQALDRQRARRLLPSYQAGTLRQRLSTSGGRDCTHGRQQRRCLIKGLAGLRATMRNGAGGQGCGLVRAIGLSKRARG